MDVVELERGGVRGRVGAFEDLDRGYLVGRLGHGEGGCKVYSEWGV